MLELPVTPWTHDGEHNKEIIRDATGFQIIEVWHFFIKENANTSAVCQNIPQMLQLMTLATSVLDPEMNRNQIVQLREQFIALKHKIERDAKEVLTKRTAEK